ncbi:MAG: ABC transporter substrate-binding protein [Pseudomonadales bacterium]|nr:ABC transporter substrate-binding protein [Pseudomonadales bacterium]
MGRRWISVVAAIAFAQIGLIASLPLSAIERSVDASDPRALIDSTSRILLDQIGLHRDDFRKHPAKLRALADQVLLPHFDTQLAAQRVLAQHWRTATPEQRKRFVEAFYNSLLAQYSDALVNFTSDRYEVLPARINEAQTAATVPTKIRRSNGEQIPVNFSLRKAPEGWRVWDITVEGISYIKSFQADFGAEISQKGLEAVIQRLEAQGAKVDDTRTATATQVNQ